MLYPLDHAYHYAYMSTVTIDTLVQHREILANDHKFTAKFICKKDQITKFM